MSKNLFATVLLRGNQTKLVHAVFTESLNMMFFSHFVSVAKHQIVVLKFGTNDTKMFVLLDGPDLGVNRKAKIEQTVLFSTFQSVLQYYHVLTPRDRLGNAKAFQGVQRQLAHTVKYTGFSKRTSEIFVSHNTSFKLNLSAFACHSLSGMHCVFHVFTQNNLHTNITLETILYSGFTYHFCKYGGLAVYEGYKHLLHTCESYGDKSSRPSRNLYATRSSSIIVVYSYRTYSSVTGTLRVATTSCKVLRMDVSKLHEKCPGSRRTLPPCQQYTNHMSNGTYFTFDHRMREDRTSLLISMQKDKCGVIQIADAFSGTAIYSDHRLQLFPASPLDSDRALDFVVHGFFKEYQRHSAPTLRLTGSPFIVNAVEINTNLPDMETCLDSLDAVKKMYQNLTLSGIDALEWFQNCSHKHTLLNCLKFLSSHKCHLVNSKNSILPFFFNYTTLSPNLVFDGVEINIILNNDFNMAVDIFIFNRQKSVQETRITPEIENVGNSKNPEDSFIVQIKNVTKCLLNNTEGRFSVEMETETQYFHSNLHFPDLNKFYRADIHLSCLHPNIFLSVPGTIAKKTILLYHLEDSEVSGFWAQTVAQRYKQYSCFEYLQTDPFKKSSCYNIEHYGTFGHARALIFNLSSKIFHFRFRTVIWWFEVSKVDKYKGEVRRMDWYLYDKEHHEITDPVGTLCRYIPFYGKQQEIRYKNGDFHSWNSAHHLCHNISASLPLFVGRRDVEEFVALLKQRYDLPLLEAIFIALRIGTEKVVPMYPQQPLCFFRCFHFAVN